MVSRTIVYSAFSCITTWLVCLLISLSGDIHLNPGPSSTSSSNEADLSSCSFEYLSGMFSVFHVNIQSLRPKLDLLEYETQFYDVIVFTETWLNNTIQDNSLQIPNFSQLHRLDRQNRIGGGVAIYVRDSLTSKRRYDLEVTNLEAIWVEVKIKSRTILIGGIYRPPNSKADYTDRIHESIERAKSLSMNNIIVTGDFNLNQFDNSDNRKINDISMKFGLQQLIKEHTHFTEHSSSLIDLMFVIINQ